jgi:hypothetical protein
MTVDSNNQLLCLAIAFAKGENGDSWYWFLERLKNMMVQDVQNVCVIHCRGSLPPDSNTCTDRASGSNG